MSAEFIESLRQQITHSEIAANAEAKYADELHQQLAECQARKKELLVALSKIAEIDINNSWSCQSGMARAALTMPSDSTALDAMLKQEFERGYDSGFLVGAEKGRNIKEEIKQAKREALLEAVDRLNPGYGDYAWRWICDELTRMAEELK